MHSPQRWLRLLSVSFIPCGRSQKNVSRLRGSTGADSSPVLPVCGAAGSRVARINAMYCMLVMRVLSNSRFLLEVRCGPSMRSTTCPRSCCRPCSSTTNAVTDPERPSDTSTPLPSALAAGSALPAHIRASSSLQPAHVGQYYPVDESKIPEAFQHWYTNRDARASKAVPVEGGGSIKPLPNFVAGCPGLQSELAQSQHPYLMYR